jgi:putative sigma-54 modulation protein
LCFSSRHAEQAKVLDRKILAKGAHQITLLNIPTQRCYDLLGLGWYEMEGNPKMNTAITGRHMEMTDALRAYIENGLQKLETHFDKVLDADVVLTVEKHRHIAEINLHANSIRIHSRESSMDMYASVDAVMEKLEKQVRKFKDRINRHQPRRVREARSYGHAILTLDESVAEQGETEEKDYAHSIVHHEKVAMKPMNVNEAMMQLELVDEPFLVFLNADTSRVNVLYSREDSTYGLIEPEF